MKVTTQTLGWTGDRAESSRRGWTHATPLGAPRTGTIRTGDGVPSAGLVGHLENEVWPINVPHQRLCRCGSTRRRPGKTTPVMVRAASYAAVTISTASRPSCALTAGGRPSRTASTKSPYWRMYSVAPRPRSLPRLNLSPPLAPRLSIWSGNTGHIPLDDPIADDSDMPAITVDAQFMLEAGLCAGRRDEGTDRSVAELETHARRVLGLHRMCAMVARCAATDLHRPAHPAHQVHDVHRLVHEHATVEGTGASPRRAVVVRLRAVNTGTRRRSVPSGRRNPG